MSRMPFARLGALLTAVVATAATAAVTAPTAGAAAQPAAAQAGPVATAPAGGVIAPVVPYREIDTRDGGVRIGGLGDCVPPAAGVPAGARAVLLNVTTTSATGPGYLVVSALGQPGPSVSNVNYAAGATVPNMVLTQISAQGCYSITQSGPYFTHYTVDVIGFVGPGASTTPGTMTPTQPARLLDTRTRGVAVPAGGSVEIPVAGHGGVPASGAAAVALNLTVTKPTAAGWALAYPSGSPMPAAGTTLSVQPGETRAALSLVKVGANGRVTVHNGSRGTMHVIADVFGWVRSGDSTGTLATLVPTDPHRSLDTRLAQQRLAPGGLLTVTNAQLGIPADADGVVVTATATNASGSGNLLLGGTGTHTPIASSVNFSAGRNVSNQVLATTNAQGLSIYNPSPSSVDVVIDVTGWVRPLRSMAGHVLDGASRAPVGGASLLSTAVTSAPDGTYAVDPYGGNDSVPCVSWPGPEYLDACAPAHADIPVGGRLSGVDVLLPPAGLLNGVARDVDGNRFHFANVDAFPVPGGQSTHGNLNQTDAGFTMKVKTGDYILRLGQAAYGSRQPSYGWADEWFDDLPVFEVGQPDIAAVLARGARRVTVTQGHTTGVTFTVPANGRLSGVVKTAAGSTPTSAYLRLFSADGQTSFTQRFTFGFGTNWHPGSYKVCASATADGPARCYPGNVAPEDATPVSLSPDQVVGGIQITLP